MLVYILTSRTELAVYWITVAADMMTFTVLAVDCDELINMLQLAQNFDTWEQLYWF